MAWVMESRIESVADMMEHFLPPLARERFGFLPRDVRMIMENLLADPVEWEKKVILTTVRDIKAQAERLVGGLTDGRHDLGEIDSVADQVDPVCRMRVSGSQVIGHRFIDSDGLAAEAGETR